VSPAVKRRGTGFMFFRMLLRASLRRRQRPAAALGAMIVAAAAATAILILYSDVQIKLQSEFRNYGANVIAIAKSGQSFDEVAINKVNRTLSGRGLAVPFAYVVARTASDRPIVVAGTDMAKIRKLDRWWSVTAWPTSAHDALMGVKTAATVSQTQPFKLNFQQKTIVLNPVGSLRTGSSEDSRIFVSLDDFQTWTGVAPSTIEMVVSGSPAEINSALRDVTMVLPEAEVRPVRQLVEGETRILGRMRSTLLLTTILIVVTATLCLLATLTGWVLDRRRDFAVMKALGASNMAVHGFFAAEAAMLGAAGAMIGFAVGSGIAIWISRANFNAGLTLRWLVFPPVLIGGTLIALIAAAVPISLLGRIEPASILRGE